MHLIHINRLNKDIAIRHLDAEMDMNIARLINRFFEARSILFPEIREELFIDFKDDFFSYFDRRNNQFKKQDLLFNNLTIISNFYVNLHLFKEAELFWDEILSIVTEWETARNSRIHKGSIFYFMAGAALRLEEYDKVFFLIHKAYQEDCITCHPNRPNTPAYKSVHFNIRSKKNYLYHLLRDLWDFLYCSIRKYNSTNKRKITRTQVYKRFIENSINEEALISFSFSLAKARQLSILSPHYLTTDFAGLYELGILFDLILVIDNFIFSKIPNNPRRNDWMFFRIASYILRQAQLEKNSKHCQENLNEVDRQQKNDFDLTIANLLSGSFVFPHPKRISRLYTDICICYCIRNFSAHNIHLTDTVAMRFDDILQRILNVLFLAIEVL